MENDPHLCVIDGGCTIDGRTDLSADDGQHAHPCLSDSLIVLKNQEGKATRDQNGHNDENTIHSSRLVLVLFGLLLIITTTTVNNSSVDIE